MLFQNIRVARCRRAKLIGVNSNSKPTPKDVEFHKAFRARASLRLWRAHLPSPSCLPRLTRIFVPASAANWEYALGSFVECDAPSACATSKINSSPGAYGWTGWIDRATGYYALIAVEISSGGDRKGVNLEQVMQDLIEVAIANRTPVP